MIEECLAARAPGADRQQRPALALRRRDRPGEARGARGAWAAPCASPTAPRPSAASGQDAAPRRVQSPPRPPPGRGPGARHPVHRGRTDGAPSRSRRRSWGSILPAAWSFMLAAAPAASAPPGRRSTSARAGGRRDPRHPLRRGHAGGADPGRLHHGHGLPAGAARPWTRRPLGHLVSPQASPRPPGGGPPGGSQEAAPQAAAPRRRDEHLAGASASPPPPTKHPPSPGSCGPYGGAGFLPGAGSRPGCGSTCATTAGRATT